MDIRIIIFAFLNITSSTGHMHHMQTAHTKHAYNPHNTYTTHTNALTTPGHISIHAYDFMYVYNTSIAHMHTYIRTYVQKLHPRTCMHTLYIHYIHACIIHAHTLSQQHMDIFPNIHTHGARMQGHATCITSHTYTHLYILTYIKIAYMHTCALIYLNIQTCHARTHTRQHSPAGMQTHTHVRSRAHSRPHALLHEHAGTCVRGRLRTRAS